MRDLCFYEFVISEESHVIISADDKAYSIIKNNVHTTFEEYVVPAYREAFIKNISVADNTWFPTRILSKDNNPFFYARAYKKNNTICIVLVNIDELLESHNDLAISNATHKAQLSLYDDVFFEYSPSNGNIEVYNTQNANFDSGIYNVDEFEAILCNNLSTRQQSVVRSFIGQMKSKVGRFSVKINSNILNDDTNATMTILEGSYFCYYKQSEAVIGHIHLESGSGKTIASSIKHDSLTGLVDKTDIMRIAQERIDERRLLGTTLAIVDIDFFKNINDTYGHQFGDTVIKRIADIIAEEVGNNGICGRFGGDEFLIIFYNIIDENTLRSYLRGIKNMVSAMFSDKGIDENTPLSVSIGAAVYPKDADCYEDLFMLADNCLYIAKEKGRNRYIIYTEEKHGSIEEIRLKSMTKKKINDRGELSPGDVLVKMYDVTLHGSGSSPETLLDEFAESFELQHVALYVGDVFDMRYAAGSYAIKDRSSIEMMNGILNSDTKDRYLADRDFIVVNRVDSLPPQASSIRNFLKENGVLSFILIRFYDRDNKECILIISSVGKYVQWNQMQFKYYRAFADILSKYSLSI